MQVVSLLALLLLWAGNIALVQGVKKINSVTGSDGCVSGTKRLFKVDFDNWDKWSRYSSSRLNEDFHTDMTNSHFKGTRIVPGYKGNGLEISYPSKCVGSSCTLWFQVPIEKTEEVFVSFKAKFAKDFTFVKGGKLPGVCGGKCNTGFKTSSGYDGFSSRIMWRENGQVVSYAYHPGQRQNYGDDYPWDRSITRNKWVKLSQRIVLNTPGKKDGAVEGYIGNKRVYGNYEVAWRKTKNLYIEDFQFSTFFGGDNWTWAPRKTQTVIFDDIVVCVKK